MTAAAQLILYIGYRWLMDAARRVHPSADTGNVERRERICSHGCAFSQNARRTPSQAESVFCLCVMCVCIHNGFIVCIAPPEQLR